MVKIKGQTINLPDSLKLYKNGVPIGIVENLIRKDLYSFIIYIDGNCHRCIDELRKWKSFAKTHNRIQYIFVINAEEYNDFENYCKVIDFEFPVVYDQYNVYSHLNKINKIKHVLFLSKNQKILLFGSPFFNKEILDGYKKYINDICKH